jgi:hypothetical protein
MIVTSFLAGIIAGMLILIIARRRPDPTPKADPTRTRFVGAPVANRDEFGIDEWRSWGQEGQG